MILDKILVHKRKELADLKLRVPIETIHEKLNRSRLRRRSFKKALRTHQVNIIAEIKKASPSKGIICKAFDPVRIAHLYEYAGAAAISVLTETHFFKGDLAYVKQVREVTARPVLRKDFIIDEYQIHEAALAGADAVLLIAAVLSAEEIKRYSRLLAEYEIDQLVEVHTSEELERVLDAGVDIIGINNRNLYTFDVSLDTTYNLLRRIPKNTTVVSESGIGTLADIQALRSVGVHAFLIGESILRADNIVDKIHELQGVTHL
jgi:indole-3-glycerol phosphate synthase